SPGLLFVANCDARTGRLSSAPTNREAPRANLFEKRIAHMKKLSARGPLPGRVRLPALIGLLVATAMLAIGAQAASGETAPATSPPTPIEPSTLSLAGIPQHNETLGSSRAPVKMLYFSDPQ